MLGNLLKYPGEDRHYPGEETNYYHDAGYVFKKLASDPRAHFAYNLEKDELYVILNGDVKGKIRNEEIHIGELHVDEDDTIIGITIKWFTEHIEG